MSEKPRRPQVLAGLVRRICRALHNETATKKHGGYLIYDDDFVRLSLDTYVANVSACVKVDGQTISVLHVSYNDMVQVYIEGKWEAYLESFMPMVQAKDAMDEAKNTFDKLCKEHGLVKKGAKINSVFA
jgi:hypothetical protein